MFDLHPKSEGKLKKLGEIYYEEKCFIDTTDILFKIIFLKGASRFPMETVQITLYARLQTFLKCLYSNYGQYSSLTPQAQESEHLQDRRRV